MKPVIHCCHQHARTLHSLLGARPDTRQFKHHAAKPLDVDVLIVDEASRVHLEMMDALLQALPPTARLVLLGDKDRLASVEARAVRGDLCRDAAAGRFSADTAEFVQAVAGQTLPAEFLATDDAPVLAQQTVMLRESRRFKGAIGQLAQAVNRGDAAAARAAMQNSVGASLCSRTVACTSARLGVLTGKPLASPRIRLAPAFTQKTLVPLGLALARAGVGGRLGGFGLFGFLGLRGFFRLVCGGDGGEIVCRLAGDRYGQPAKPQTHAYERGH